MMFLIGVTVGGAAVWFGKAKIEAMVIGVNALSAKLHAQADALLAKKP